jgi:ParB family chromosome partitioning protein
MKVHAIADMWPAMTAEEWEEFKADVGANGLLVPIVTWREAIVDGKHRARACDETGAEPRYDVLDATWDEWRVVLHCLSLHRRRNLTSGQRAAVGWLASERYKPAAETRMKAGTLAPPGARVGKASRAAAKEVGSSERSVERAGLVLREAPAAFERVREGKLPLKVAERIAKAPESERAAMLAQLDTDARPVSSGDSWGTPPEWIDLARKVMGGIDLDPASNAHAQATVCAEHYHTSSDDGLKHEWRGRIWLNPPYSQPAIQEFAEKLLNEIDAEHVAQACVLVNNATDTKWAQLLLRMCDAVLFPAGRIAFILPGTDKLLEGARQGQMLIYFGKNTKRFESVCASAGWVGVTP